MKPISITKVLDFRKGDVKEGVYACLLAHIMWKDKLYNEHIICITEAMYMIERNTRVTSQTKFLIKELAELAKKENTSYIRFIEV